MLTSPLFRYITMFIYIRTRGRPGCLCATAFTIGREEQILMRLDIYTSIDFTSLQICNHICTHSVQGLLCDTAVARDLYIYIIYTYIYIYIYVYIHLLTSYFFMPTTMYTHPFCAGTPSRHSFCNLGEKRRSIHIYINMHTLTSYIFIYTKKHSPNCRHIYNHIRYSHPFRA